MTVYRVRALVRAAESSGLRCGSLAVPTNTVPPAHARHTWGGVRTMPGGQLPPSLHLVELGGLMPGESFLQEGAGEHVARTARASCTLDVTAGVISARRGTGSIWHASCNPHLAAWFSPGACSAEDIASQGQEAAPPGVGDPDVSQQPRGHRAGHLLAAPGAQGRGGGSAVPLFGGGDIWCRLGQRHKHGCGTSVPPKLGFSCLPPTGPERRMPSHAWAPCPAGPCDLQSAWVQTSRPSRGQ